jgi:two-component system NtrC family sensor kinase
VHRTLRLQLIAIVVATVATVLAVSQWLDTRLSEGALERDLEERARVYLRTVDSLWGRTGTETLRREFETLVEGDRELTAIDVLRRREGRFEVVLTTRPPGEAAPPELAPALEAQLLAQGAVRTATERRADAVIWRIAGPVVRDGALVGAVQAEFSLAEIMHLEQRLRRIGMTFLVTSIVLISLLLFFFLERRVGRPVASLVDGMRRAEAGELGARVRVPGGGEFAFLAGRFNDMLARLEDLTAGLESRVRQATHELADTNRDLKEANEKLWRARLEVGRSERLAALGQMAATIAHELGTPLNSVLGYTQLLQRENLPAEQASKLAVIESQVQRMIETIRSVLDRTRDREVGRGPVVLAPLVSEAIGLVSARLAGRAIVLRAEVPPDLPPVPGDAAALRQVLINLLANAIDATGPPGTIVVGATVLTPNGRGPQVEISVRDSGHGMTEDEVRRVFEPFYTTKAPGRGTGLGLAIVDHIVRAHGGQVLVESVPGRGTTMRMRLPMET